MSTPNVKVVSVLPGPWRIVALFGAGGGLSVVVYGLEQISPLLAEHINLVFVILAAGLLVPLSFSEQRLRRSCHEAVAVGAGVAIGYSALILVWAAELVVAVLLCLVVRLVGLWYVRSFMRRLIVQTGSLCWTCAYDLTGNESGVCPECGEGI